MNYILENDKLKVEISDLGAELQSIKGKKTGFEYLWQGSDEFWKSRSSVLFPICGRLYQGKYTYAGKTYEMNLHGFARKLVFNMTRKTDSEVEFTLTSNEELKKQYPFDFVFKMIYTLNGNKLTNTFFVENTGREVLPCSFGGHPGFNVPLQNKGVFEDCYLEFGCAKTPKRLILTESCVYSGKDENFNLEDGKILRLKHNLFDDDAIFLKDTCNKVSLKSTKCDAEISVSYSDMKVVGFWHSPKTEAPFVCIEPWYGTPATEGITDDFSTKEYMIQIEKGKTCSKCFDIEINE